VTHSGPSEVAPPHPVSLVPTGRGALGVSGIKASASVTSGDTNRARVAEKSIGELIFDLTGAPSRRAPANSPADGRANSHVVARIRSRAKSAPCIDIYVRRTCFGRPPKLQHTV
jgi:hypothetical protein